ncbi:MAG: hypothetical protein IJ698_00410 [Prevotella sp.]|nr:hypothetical protein [Prevotella sp.]
MEAPERIYLQEPTKVRTQKMYDNDIEYVRKDAFIEKAVNYLNSKLYDWVQVEHFGTATYPETILKQDFIEDFKLNFLDTLEVKEVDEIKIGETQIYLEDDGGEQPYDGKQWLDLSCTEYEIPKALFKDGDNVEILIRKAQKGE